MKKGLIITASIAVLIWGGLTLLRMQAKSRSPEAGFTFDEGDLKIHVFYNRPSKKGREIFSENGLVPYGKVWRTGANEATSFETNKALSIKGKELKPGKYSLWTIPGKDTWTVIFNSENPSWGINFNGEPNRDAKNDVVVVEVPVLVPDSESEQLTIELERVDDEIELILRWDRTLVAVPITVSGQ